MTKVYVSEYGLCVEDDGEIIFSERHIRTVSKSFLSQNSQVYTLESIDDDVVLVN